MDNNLDELKNSEIWSGNKKIINFYSNKYHIQAAILDILLNYQEMSLPLLEKLVFNSYPTVDSWYNMPVSDFQQHLRELWLIGAVKMHIDGVEDSEIDEYIEKNQAEPNFNKRLINSVEIKGKTHLKLTEIGIDIIRNQTFHSNALSSLSTKRLYRLSTLTITLSVIAIVISIIAIYIKE